MKCTAYVHVEQKKGLMIQCEKCFYWSHAKCLGIERTGVPNIFICLCCRDENSTGNNSIDNCDSKSANNSANGDNNTPSNNSSNNKSKQDTSEAKL